MTYRHLTDLADVLRAAGLRVVELPGWKTRGRPSSTGGFDPQGNLWHHTGGADGGRKYAEWLATKGRSDLPAPLCGLFVDRDGTVYVCAAGRANHAGKAKASGPCPAGDGNTLYLGWECANTGTEGWTAEQYHAMRVGAAATSSHYGWPASHNRAHRETSVTGKWDPGRLDMDRFRRDVAATMNGEGEDMPLTDADVEKVAKAVARFRVERVTGAPDGAYLAWLNGATYNKLVALEGAVAALAKGISPAVEAAVQEALADAVVNVDVNVNGGAAK